MSNIFTQMSQGIENTLGLAPQVQTSSAPLPGTQNFDHSVPAVTKTQFSPRPVPAEWQPAITSAYIKNPSLPKGIIESVLMKESSMGTNASGYNKANGESAWLGGLTQGAKSDLQKKGQTPNFDTQAGAINGVASYLANRQSGTLNNGKPYKITDPQKLYFDRYTNPKNNTPKDRKIFNQYMSYYSRPQTGNQLALKNK
jgi:hypothetical protein